jgi:hypothetical protein
MKMVRLKTHASGSGSSWFIWYNNCLEHTVSYELSSDFSLQLRIIIIVIIYNENTYYCRQKWSQTARAVTQKATASDCRCNRTDDPDEDIAHSGHIHADDSVD